MKIFAVFSVCWLFLGAGCASAPKTGAVVAPGARRVVETKSATWGGWNPTKEKGVQLNHRFNGLVDGEGLVRREGAFRRVVAGMTRAQALAELGAPLVSDARHAKWSAADPSTGTTVVLDLLWDDQGVIRYTAVTKPVSAPMEAFSTANASPALRADLDPRFDGVGWTGKSPRDPAFNDGPNIPFPELLSKSQ